MSIWTRLYQHTSYRGRSTYASLPYQFSPSTYQRISKGWLDSVNLHDRISSLDVGASRWEQGGYTILFQHSNYRGRYVMFSATPGSTVRTAHLFGENFNDRTSSALIVRRFSVELPPIALGGLGTPPLRQQIGDLSASIPRLSPRGDPVITWDMWPGFSPSSKYVYIRVPVRVDVPNWFDYDAEIRLWIYLYVNSGGRARGYVAWYGARVEGGWKTGSILDRLMDGIPSRLGDINSRISNALSSLDALSFVRLYYLPGTASHTGHVNDDVSIVLVKQV